MRKEELLSVYSDLGNMEYGDGLETFLSVTESDQAVWSLVIPTIQQSHLIEMVINLQKTVDMQGKKVIDLEDYIDNLLIKVLDVAPILLKQESPLISKHAIG